MARALSWIVTAALALGGFVAAREVAARRAGKAAPAAPEARRPAAPGPAIAPRPGEATRAPAPADDPGVALVLEVNGEYPVEGPATWAAIDRAVMRAMEDLVAARGMPAAACGGDGALDDAILMIQWNVAARADRVAVEGGRAVDADLPDATRACLDAYLGGARATDAPPYELVELDVRYELPFPAGARAEPP